MKSKILITVTLILSLFYAQIALAQYGYFPQQFYGSVTVNGVPAPDGVLISAKFEGSDVEGGLTTDGKYGYETAFVVALQETDAGETIEFYVQNVKAAEYLFSPGYSTELNLSVGISNFCGDGNCESGEDCSSCSLDCGECAPPTPPGGGGGGGGGITPPSGSAACEEDWICTDWSDCFNNIQTRVCADDNRCGTTEEKPIERQDCVMPIICEPDERKCEGDNLIVCSALGTTWISLQECEFGCSNGECIEEGTAEELPTGPTAFFLLSPTDWMVGIISGLIIALIVIFYITRTRKSKRKK